MGLLGSQLVPRPGVQNSVIQAIQPPSSFYSNNGGGAPGAPPAAPPTGPGGPQQAAGFYTASGSPLQAAVQQQAQPPLQTPPAAFGLQGFGNQSQPGPAGVGMQGFGSSMSLAAQQLGAQAFRGGPTLQPSFLKSLQPGASIQDTSRQQLKSPGAAQNSFSTFFPPSSSISSTVNSSNSNSTSSHGGSSVPQISSPKAQNRKMPSQPGLAHQSSNRSSSYPTQNTSQMMAGSLRSSGMVMSLRGQLPMATQSGLSGPTPPMATNNRYPNPGPIQRPPASQGTGSNTSHRSSRGQSQGQQQQTQTQQRTSNPPSSAQQAKLRADALSTTQAFFNRDAGKSEKKEEKPAETTVSGKEELTADKVSAASSSVGDGPPK